MLARVYSCALTGLSGTIIEVEVDSSTSEEPKTIVVGLPDTAVMESKERVRGAIRNSGLKSMRNRIAVNLAPAALRKEGTGYDRPMALGILAANGMLEHEALAGTMICGELSLDGAVISGFDEASGKEKEITAHYSYYR